MTTRLKTYQTQTIFKLESRGAGTYVEELLIEGNSLLSTLFVQSVSGGSVKVNYYEDTTGGKVGERKELPGHPLQAAGSLDPSKITVTPFHNTPIMEVVVTGTAIFSVHVTVVNSFATDLDAALAFDGDSFEPTGDKAIPIACLDEETNKLFFLRCKNGSLISDPINAGDAVYIDGVEVSTPTTQQTLASFTVGAGTKRLLGGIKVSSFRSGTWIAEVDSAIIASGRTSAGHPDSYFEFIPRRELSALSLFNLKYFALSGPASDVHYHVMATEI